MTLFVEGFLLSLVVLFGLYMVSRFCSFAIFKSWKDVFGNNNDRKGEK